MKRPFSEQADIRCRGYALLFQRRITDFGAEKSFARAVRQIEAHDGREVSPSAVRRITEQQGQHLQEQSDYSIGTPAQERVQQLIAEADGTANPKCDLDLGRYPPCYRWPGGRCPEPGEEEIAE